MKNRIKGVLSPVVTPFGDDYKPNSDRFVRQCRWLQDNHVGLAVFGTNSEANSLTVSERMDLLDALVSAKINTAKLMPGTGACALNDSVQLTSGAVKHGCAGVLMLPPFYYKGVTDDGLYRYFSEVIQRVGDERLNIYLYHIPPVSQVPISMALIERLLKEYPSTIAGIKDSSGDWNTTQALLERFQPQGFDVFVGSESFLLANMRGGGVGCISATANVNPAAIHRLYEQWQQDDADQQQQRLNDVRNTFAKQPMIPALKHAIAHWSGVPEWSIVRPPLVELDQKQGAQLISDLDAMGFAMSGLKE